MKTRYTLEEHLQSNTVDDTTLLDTWRINKKRFTNTLQATVQSFPTYSLHDLSHSNNVIDNIECLLSESGINQLSLTDTWLILHAALLHDWGMVLTDSQIQNAIGTKDFEEFIKKSSISGDKDLSNAIEDIENVKMGRLAVINAYGIRNSMTLILSEYFRKYHGENSHKQILDNIFCNYNLSYDLIQSRLLEILADIVLCHTRNIEFVLKLPQQQKGQNKDLFHPRFIAMLLRLGDLLDMENNRFNDSIFLTFFERLPEKSMLHLKKHHSLKELSITNEAIEIKLDCPDTSTYRIARQTIDWLKTDLDFFMLNWNVIVPRDYNGHMPTLEKHEVLINDEDVGHLQLSFSKEQIYNMLEGYNLYSEQFVCIREIIQNAIDASKIQIYRDIVNEKYGNNVEKLLSSPYDLFCNKILEKYPINIIVKIEKQEMDKLKIYLEISDFGTGINEDALMDISNVCVSYKNRKKDKEEYLQMPKWLRPTGGFGIGIQSVFTLTNILQMLSKAEDEKFGKSIEITPMKYGGYISVTIDRMRKKRGTEVKFDFEMEKDELDYITKEKYIFNNFHYESEEQYYIDYFKHFIMKKFSYNLLPLYFNGEPLGDSLSTEDSEIFILNSTLIYQYIYKDKSNIFKFWDRENNVFVRFRKISSFLSNHDNKIYFRGVEVQDENVSFADGMNLSVDIYGEDVQECLGFSRNKFNFLYRKKFDLLCKDLTKKAIEVYIDILKRRLEFDRKWELLYVYLLSIKYNLNFNYKDVQANLPIYKLKNDKYILKHIDLLVYVEILSNDFFVMFPEKEMYADFEEIENDNVWHGIRTNPCDVLNGEKITNKPQYIIYDLCFLEIVSEMCSIVDEDRYGRFKLLKCNLTNENKRLYKKRDIEEFYDDFLHDDGYVPAVGLERFSMLEIVISGIIFDSSCYYQIISPLNKTDIEKINDYTKEQFINRIISGIRFANIVDKVYDEQKNATYYDHEEIRSGYKELISELYDYNFNKNV